MWRLAGRLGVPLAIFARYYDLAYLNVANAPRMLVGDDWTTYLVSPNYLRSSSVFAFPIGELTHYLSPVGTSLAQTDSLPILTPIYRVLLALLPGRPIQLVGPLILSAILLTFNAVARFLDSIEIDRPWLAREAATLAAAALLVTAPFWNLQHSHPALMQQWIIVWSLSLALRRCPGVLRGKLRVETNRWAGLGPVFAASAVQPYLIPMVLVPGIAPDLIAWRTQPKWLLTKLALALGGTVVITYTLGYLVTGVRLGSTGFGAYSADLLALVDSDGHSRLLANLPSTPDAVGGYAYVGLGGVALLLSGIVIAIGHRWNQRTQSNQAVREGKGKPRILYGSVLLLSVYALMPQIRLGGETIVDLSALTEPLSSLTALFRVNGRFVWVVVWLGLLLVSGWILVGLKAHHAVWLLSGCLVLQIVDVIPFPLYLRDPATIEYDGALAQLQQEKNAGVRSIQFQPPLVIPGCYPPEFRSFAAVGDVLLASAVLDLPVNSGYTARAREGATVAICEQQAQEFRLGTVAPTILYIVPKGGFAPESLNCSPLTSHLDMCRSRMG
jgi:hypothetical protein